MVSIRPTTASPAWLQWGFDSLCTWTRRASRTLEVVLLTSSCHRTLSPSLQISPEKLQKISTRSMLMCILYIYIHIHIYLCVFCSSRLNPLLGCSSSLHLLGPALVAWCLGSRCSQPVPVSPHARGHDPRC